MALVRRLSNESDLFDKPHLKSYNFATTSDKSSNTNTIIFKILSNFLILEISKRRLLDFCYCKYFSL